MPEEEFFQIQTIGSNPDRIWIGTANAGLIEVDRHSGKTRRLTEKDGLLMDDILSLLVRDQEIWIGFGRERVGGLGKLDLRTGQIRAFSPALSTEPFRAAVFYGKQVKNSDQEPPRQRVLGLAAGLPGELWLLVHEKGLQRFRPNENVWETLSPGLVPANCVAADGEKLVVGLRVATSENSSRPRGGIKIRNLRTGEWQTITDKDKLPSSSTALALAGSEAWVGGSGYIACVDLSGGRVREVAYISGTAIDRLRVCGGYLWAQFQGHLYRIELNKAR